MAESNFWSDYLKKMWITKGARFKGSRRLRKTYQLSVFSISLLSFYIIALCIIQLVGWNIFGNIQEKFITTFTLSLSVFTLILSIFESSKDLTLKAEALHKCAIEIGSLYDRLNISLQNNETPGKDTFDKEYNEIIKECSVNHDEIDHLNFKASNASEFKISALWALVIRIWVETKPYLFYYFLIFAPIVVTILLYSPTNASK